MNKTISSAKYVDHILMAYSSGLSDVTNDHNQSAVKRLFNDEFNYPTVGLMLIIL